MGCCILHMTEGGLLLCCRYESELQALCIL
jgi:hypothetical protein